MDLRWEIAVIFLFTLILATTDTVQGSTTNDILRNDLKHFNMNRHHVINPGGKEQARNYIRNTLNKLGLHTWTEPFNPRPGTSWSGTNIVGVLPGRQYKTIYDRVILIGAHYDTMRDTKGVDDNGSGVVAMLQVARQLTGKSSSCTREYSVMFVAFDFEEWENSLVPGCACSELGCGSRAFVSNFSLYYNLFPNMYVAKYGQLHGAIIMDTMMNYNSTPDSQFVPQQLNKIFPNQYNSIIGNAKRGDFLLATGRCTDDMPLLNTFNYFYSVKDSEQGSKYKIRAFPLPFDGPTNNILVGIRAYLSPFLRSDHISFWNEQTSNRAIFLTDTASMRGYMKKCYHEECDNVSHVTNDVLGFLFKSCDTIVMTTNDLTKTRCQSRRSSPQSEGLTAAEGGGIGIAATMFAAINAIAAWVCCQRRKQNDQNVLVENDQMEEGRTDVTAQTEAPEDQQPPEA